MREPQLYLFKAGCTFPEVARSLGDFDDWLIAGLGPSAGRVRVLEVWRDEIELPEPAACSGVLMTGAHGMVTDRLPWMRRMLDWLPRMVAAGTPYLGICFGHQILAEALGGRVDFHPKGREIGTVEIRLHAATAVDPLFQCLPRRFPAHAVHAQSALTLPPGATLLAGNGFEPHHAFRVGKRAWGLQFHPEFNRQRMAAYVAQLAPKLHAAGQDIAAISAGLADTPIAATLLPRFARLVRDARIPPCI